LGASVGGAYVWRLLPNGVVVLIYLRFCPRVFSLATYVKRIMTG